MTTELTLPQRAAVALGAAEHEKNLVLLAEEAKSITEIKNADARAQCHGMMMTMKNARVAIEKSGKAAREDATAFSKAVIAEEKRLISITQAEEERLQALRDKWDADREAERQAAIEAERQRIAGIRGRIAVLSSLPVFLVGKSAADIRAALASVRDTIIDDSFAEFKDDAMNARSASFNALESMLEGAENAEVEAARIAAEREELARLRAEAESRRKADAEKAEAVRQEEERRLADERARIEAEAQQNAEAELRSRVSGAAGPAIEASGESVSSIVSMHPRPTTATGAPTLRLGQINERIAPLSITADGLRSLGFEAAGREKNAILYHEEHFPNMCAAMQMHLTHAAAKQAA